jgi:gliding motility-associated-like protein
MHLNSQWPLLTNKWKEKFSLKIANQNCSFNKILVIAVFLLRCSLFSYAQTNPIAVADYDTTGCYQTITLQPVANDSCSFAMILKAAYSISTKGVFSYSGNNIVYQPDTCFNGLDSLYYVVCKVADTTKCDTAMAYIYISGCQCNVPTSNFIGLDSSICQYQSVQFLDKSTNVPTSWKWYFTGASIDSSILQNPIAAYNNAGKFSVKMMANNNYGNGNWEEKINYINVIHTLANVPIDTIYANPNTSIALNILRDSIALYSWVPQLNLSDPNIYNPTFYYSGGLVELPYSIAYNANCFTKSKVVILPVPNLPNGNVIIPNAITPNGDGINDVWKISYNYLKSFDVKIYNRWGDCVFASTNPNQAWNGTTNGVDIKMEVFDYLINVTYTNGVTDKLSGDITVIY